MSRSTQTNVVVLGARGMLGRVVYAYLSSQPGIEVWGTHHQDTGPWLRFRANHKENDVREIAEKIGPIDAVINCIGMVRALHGPRENLFQVNAELPKWLEGQAEADNFRLIQISTDAVFGPQAGAVTELSPVGPEDEYGESKLAGETQSHQALTVRTSLLGLDPEHGRGLVEFVRQAPKGKINGYANQTWSGATVLQVAELMAALSARPAFVRARNTTPVIHFAPLGPLSKAALVKHLAHQLRGDDLKIIPVRAPKTVNRWLTSLYKDCLPQKPFNGTIPSALKALIQFEL